MNYISDYKSYNEGFLSDVGDFLMGRTDDDKLVRKILKDIDKIEFKENGGLYPRTVSFEYGGYKFTCGGNLEFYGKDIPYSDKVVVKSKYVHDLYYKGHAKADEVEEKKRKEKEEKERKIKEDEFIEYVESKGGLESIINKMLIESFEKNKRGDNLTCKYDWDNHNGNGVRYDSSDDFIYIAIPTLNDNHKRITSISYDFKENKLKASYSYAAYGGKDWNIKVDKTHRWYPIFEELKSNVIKWNQIKNKKKSVKKKSILSRFK